MDQIRWRNGFVDPFQDFETLQEEINRRNGADTYRGETREGRFQRTLQLPLAVDPERVEAVLKDGVLRITLPRHEEVKPRQISVKAR